MLKQLVPNIKNENIAATLKANSKGENDFFSDEKTKIKKINSGDLARISQDISYWQFAVITCPYEDMGCYNGLREMNTIMTEMGDEITVDVYYMDSIKNKGFLRDSK